MTEGSYPDDGPGEVVPKVVKQGSTLAGGMAACSIPQHYCLKVGCTAPIIRTWP